MGHQKSPHLSLAHETWQKFLRPGDGAIDATCGNGHDTLFLAKLLLDHPESFLAAIDLQQQAIDQTNKLLKNNLTDLSRLLLERRCHADLASLNLPKKPRLIVYNLGYLPGGNKNITTQTEKTLISLTEALSLIEKDGALSITCYPGHEEGAREEKAIESWASRLNPLRWRASFQRVINRPSAPSFLWLTSS
jgi:hypothetical protein